MSRRLNEARTPSSRHYGYSSARVRGMRAHLLKPAMLDKMMEADDVTQLIQLLDETDYAQDLDAELIAGRTADAIDEALKVNIVRTFQKVMNLINDEAFDIVSTLLGHWDLFNVKSVIRGKHVHLPADQIVESLYAVGQFTPIELKDLARQSDVTAVADTLGTWGAAYARPLRNAMPEYVKDGDLAALELALDRHYGAWAHARLKGKGRRKWMALHLLGVQIDSTNLLTALRLLSADMSDIDALRFFLPGGAVIRQDLFLKLVGMSDIDEVLDALKPTPYGAALDAVGLAYLERSSISVFERALEDYVVRKSLAAGLEDPVGVGIVISFLYAKQNEVTNLRIIVKGRSVRMPAERMRKELIRV